MGLLKDYVSQTRKPEGFLGKIMLGGMNGGHAKLADWGMAHLPSLAPSEIADLGCGGGRNIGELLYIKGVQSFIKYLRRRAGRHGRLHRKRVAEPERRRDDLPRLQRREACRGEGAAFRLRTQKKK